MGKKVQFLKNLSCFSHFKIRKRGEIVSGETINWIIYIALIIAAGYAVTLIVRRASG